jgi:hypothetical protein
VDPAANVTVGASSSVPEDAMDVDRKRKADWPHSTDGGKGRSRPDRLGRLFRDTEREAELELREGEGEPPAAGNRLNGDGVDYAMAKLRRSPLPATFGAGLTFPRR